MSSLNLALWKIKWLVSFHDILGSILRLDEYPKDTIFSEMSAGQTRWYMNLLISFDWDVLTRVVQIVVLFAQYY